MTLVSSRSENVDPECLFERFVAPRLAVGRRRENGIKKEQKVSRGGSRGGNDYEQRASDQHHGMPTSFRLPVAGSRFKGY